MPPIVVVGSAVMDLVVRAPRFPVPGETLLGGSFRALPGGKGANAAVASARLGANVFYVGAVGEDAFGDAIIESMKAAGVDLKFVRRVPATATGVALITVAEGGENAIVVAPGANALVAPQDVVAALEAVAPAVTLASLEVPMAAVAACADAPGLLVVNPAPAADLPARLWSRIDWITPNEAETYAYTGIDPVDEASCREAAARFFARGVRGVALTLGARGGFLASDGVRLRYPGRDVRVADTVGAGDAFNGAFITFLAEGRPSEEAVVLANAAAALSCTREGAQGAMPTWQDLDDLLMR